MKRAALPVLLVAALVFYGMCYLDIALRAANLAGTAWRLVTWWPTNVFLAVFFFLRALLVCVAENPVATLAVVICAVAGAMWSRGLN